MYNKLYIIINYQIKPSLSILGFILVLIALIDCRPTDCIVHVFVVRGIYELQNIIDNIITIN